MSRYLAAIFLAALVAGFAAAAEEQSRCDAGPHLMWGDGEHDDTAALNAWFRGEKVVWAQTHDPVGTEISDRTFLLSSAVYISSGTGRKLTRFRMIWPERQETVSGGAILSGVDPDQPPVAEGITAIGADPDEGIPYKAPDLESREHGIPQHCLTS
jgi:hypothetical protein